MSLIFQRLYDRDGEAEWSEFREVLIKEKIDPSVITTEKLLDELLEQCWPTAKAKEKALAKTFWKKYIFSDQHSKSSSRCVKVCSKCGKPSSQEKRLKVCGRCKAAFYCNEDCQRADWPSHKLTCGKPLPPPEEEILTEEALDLIDLRNWVQTRSKLKKALAINIEFIPALLLYRSVKVEKPDLFDVDDMNTDETIEKAKNASIFNKEKSRKYIEKCIKQYNSTSTSTSPSNSNSINNNNNISGSRLVLIGLWFGLIQIDYEESMKWYKLSADKGNDIAEYNIGWTYLTKQGVKQDEFEGVKWLTLAANHGSAIAQFNLGVCYHQGKGIAVNNEEAVKWYRTSAEQGYSVAQCNLGICYQQGMGVKKNANEGFQWIKLSAEKGFVLALANLGECYLEGRGCKQDYKEAIKWIIKSANTGHPISLFNLGMCYLEGKGVTQDFQEALKWIKLAAKEGHPQAIFLLKKINGTPHKKH